ncbi:MAG: FkbM family methyltransferase [Terracidiphilus sp.]
MKREYGTIHKGDVVFDVGANIGSFAIYAGLSGASKVYSFEPSLEAFNVLTRNVQVNQLQSVIILFNKAVTDRSGEVVRFPYSSSPFNSLAITAVPGSQMHVDRFSGDLHNNALSMATRSDIDYVDIPTISLQDFMAEHNVPFIDFLKMDCEGAEFSIVPSWTEGMFKRIGRIRMECHGESAELVNLFLKNGFVIELLKGEDIWLVNRQLSSADKQAQIVDDLASCSESSARSNQRPAGT